MLKSVLRQWVAEKKRALKMGPPHFLSATWPQSHGRLTTQLHHVLSAFLIADVPCGYRGSLSAFSKKLHKHKVLRISSWKALNSLGISAEEQMPECGLPALVWPPP